MHATVNDDMEVHAEAEVDADAADDDMEVHAEAEVDAHAADEDTKVYGEDDDMDIDPT